MEGAAWLRAAVFGAGLGVALAAGLALFVTVWEVVENPGGIFRAEAGWRWDFIGDTASSWFLPSLVQIVPVTLLLSVAVTWRRRLRS